MASKRIKEFVAPLACCYEPHFPELRKVGCVYKPVRGACNAADEHVHIVGKATE